MHVQKVKLFPKHLSRLQNDFKCQQIFHGLQNKEEFSGFICLTQPLIVLGNLGDSFAMPYQCQLFPVWFRRLYLILNISNY